MLLLFNFVYRSWCYRHDDDERRQQEGRYWVSETWIYWLRIDTKFIEETKFLFFMAIGIVGCALKYKLTFTGSVWMNEWLQYRKLREEKYVKWFYG